MTNYTWLNSIVLLCIVSFDFVVNTGQAIAKSSSPQRVLITGFYDWKDLGHPSQKTRCRDNPSCRLLVTEGIGSRGFPGPLAKMIKTWANDHPHWQVDFVALPVTWQSIGTLHHEHYHLIIHLGLGVYGRYHQLLIEDGAYNLHKGKDALGIFRERTISSTAPLVLESPSLVSAGIQRALIAPLSSPFKLSKASARKSNTYLCNAIYFESLEYIIREAGHLTKEAYFIHIPHREKNSDKALATAVFEVIRSLIVRNPSTQSPQGSSPTL